MNLVAQGLDPDKDSCCFHYADPGVERYGNGVMVSPQFIKDKPQAVAGLVRVIHEGVRDAAADPDAAIAALMKREALLNKDLEKSWLLYTLQTIKLAPLASAVAGRASALPALTNSTTMRGEGAHGHRWNAGKRQSLEGAPTRGLTQRSKS